MGVTETPPLSIGIPSQFNSREQESACARYEGSGGFAPATVWHLVYLVFAGDYGWEAISKTFDMTQREVIGWYSRILIKVRKKAGSVKMGIDQEKVA
jgi:hypothetical protein